MNVLIIGSGGREHALAWKCAQSPNVDLVFVAPGNAGTANEKHVKNVPIDTMDFIALTKFAKENSVSLSIVGPEAPLVSGIVDYFHDQGLRCFGPTSKAAKLEGSKAFTKDFCSKYGIPSASYQTFTNVEAAAEYIKKQRMPIVIKADGLAGGKGVVIAATVSEALETVHDMLSGNAFGNAGQQVVIEEFLTGEEASFISIVDGETVVPMATSQDHKAQKDGDLGPNTGGMGAYSPAPVVTGSIHEKIMNEVMLPTVSGMAAEGRRYVGFLYAGLMISPQGDVNVIEFNCRFGDPEAQPIMLRLKSDLPALCLKALSQELRSESADWDLRPAVGVVMASAGYPGSYQKGEKIRGLEHKLGENEKIFHAGTVERNGEIMTDSGRVLCATSLGETVTEAQKNAYELAKYVSWESLYFRTDIAYRAIERENTSDE
tara:strand:+ start:12466 stop:13761 length:1296 start_codon:yes stop_codon:yes gene_type:complete